MGLAGVVTEGPSQTDETKQTQMIDPSKPYKHGPS